MSWYKIQHYIAKISNRHGFIKKSSTFSTKWKLKIKKKSQKKIKKKIAGRIPNKF